MSGPATLLAVVQLTRPEASVVQVVELSPAKSSAIKKTIMLWTPFVKRTACNCPLKLSQGRSRHQARLAGFAPPRREMLLCSALCGVAQSVRTAYFGGF